MASPCAFCAIDAAGAPGGEFPQKSPTNATKGDLPARPKGWGPQGFAHGNHTDPDARPDVLPHGEPGQPAPRRRGAHLREAERVAANVVQEILDAYRAAGRCHRSTASRCSSNRVAGMGGSRTSSTCTGTSSTSRCRRQARTQQLHSSIAELHAPKLERNRPGWRVFIIDGLERDRFAVYIKVITRWWTARPAWRSSAARWPTSASDRRIRSTVDMPHGPGEAAGPLPRLEHEALTLARRTRSIGRGSLRLSRRRLAACADNSAAQADRSPRRTPR